MLDHMISLRYRQDIKIENMEIKKMKVLSVNLQDNEIGAKRERVNNGFSSELP